MDYANILMSILFGLQLFFIGVIIIDYFKKNKGTERTKGIVSQFTKPIAILKGARAAVEESTIKEAEQYEGEKKEAVLGLLYFLDTCIQLRETVAEEHLEIRKHNKHSVSVAVALAKKSIIHLDINKGKIELGIGNHSKHKPTLKEQGDLMAKFGKIGAKLNTCLTTEQKLTIILKEICKEYVKNTDKSRNIYNELV